VPTYQYACTECGHGFEAVQPFTDNALTECPQCQGRLRKVFSSVGIVFKGSGFYRNDSREKANSTAAKADTGATSAAPAEKKPEAKPAGSTDSPGERKSEPKPAAKPSTDSSSRPTPSGSRGTNGSRSSTEGSAA